MTTSRFEEGFPSRESDPLAAENLHYVPEYIDNSLRNKFLSPEPRNIFNEDQSYAAAHTIETILRAKNTANLNLPPDLVSKYADNPSVSAIILRASLFIPPMQGTLESPHDDDTVRSLLAPLGVHAWTIMKVYADGFVTSLTFCAGQNTVNIFGLPDENHPMEYIDECSPNIDLTYTGEGLMQTCEKLVGF